MSRTTRRIVRMVAAIQMALLVLAIAAVPALADVGDEIPITDFTKKTGTVYLYPKSYGYTKLFDLKGKKAIKNLKSSNKKVLTISKTTYKGKVYWSGVAQKKGTTTLSSPSSLSSL